MSRAKVFTSILMVLILIALSGASVWAAPLGQEVSTTISGEVMEIVFEVDEETGDTTVLVTLLVDETTEETQTVRVSLETAAALGLVEVDANDQPVLDDETGLPIVAEGAIDSTVDIQLSLVIVDEDGEEGPHPVASALADYFADILGLDYDEIMDYHEDGTGFGVIAQACWMSMALEGDATLLGDILEAKKSGDFTSILGEDAPTNWGQFRKEVFGSEKAKKNLGTIMSGRAAEEQEQNQQQVTTTANQGQGKGNKGKKGSDEEGSGSLAEPPGKGKDKDKGGGPPAAPPDKGKDKDKGGGKGGGGGGGKKK